MEEGLDSGNGASVVGTQTQQDADRRDSRALCVIDRRRSDAR